MIWDVIYPSVFMILAVVAVTIVVSAAAALMTGIRDIYSEELQFVPLLASAVFYMVVLISQRRQFLIDEMRFGPDLRRIDPGETAAGVILLMASGDLLENLIDALRLYERFPLYTTTAVRTFQNQNLLLLVLTTVILSPLAEEMIFRGMTYRRIRQYAGNRPAVLISSLLFGLYHMNMIQFLFAFAVGILLARLYERTKTLIVPVVCHAAVNAWELFLEFVIDQPQRLTQTGRGILLFAEAVLAVLTLYYLRRKDPHSNRQIT